MQVMIAKVIIKEIFKKYIKLIGKKKPNKKKQYIRCQEKRDT